MTSGSADCCGARRTQSQLYAGYFGGTATRAGQWRVAQFANGIEQERQTDNMVKMGMRQKNVIDLRQLGDVEITGTRAGIDQNILIHQK